MTVVLTLVQTKQIRINIHKNYKHGKHSTNFLRLATQQTTIIVHSVKRIFSIQNLKKKIKPCSKLDYTTFPNDLFLFILILHTSLALIFTSHADIVKRQSEFNSYSRNWTRHLTLKSR